MPVFWRGNGWSGVKFWTQTLTTIPLESSLQRLSIGVIKHCGSTVKYHNTNFIRYKIVLVAIVFGSAQTRRYQLPPPSLPPPPPLESAATAGRVAAAAATHQHSTPQPLRSIAAAVTHQRLTPPPCRCIAALFAAPQQAFAFPSLPPIMYANKTNGSYVCPPSGTKVVEGKHPSQGGNPYLVELPQIVISMWENREDLRAPWLMQLRHQRKFPSLSTCERWIHQYQAEGKLSGFLFPIGKG
jgi:hypothetical protein